MQLQVNDTKHFMRKVDDPTGAHYIVDGITDVIDPREPLVVIGMNVCTSYHPDLLRLQADPVGNMTIVLPINAATTLYIRGVLIIDAAFINMLKDTPLHVLVANRIDCLAVSGYEILSTHDE